MTDVMLRERVDETLVTNGIPVLDDAGVRLSPRTGFWVVAMSMAALTAFSTAPSALYGIYARTDHLSSITITLVYSVYAAGILASLLLVGHVSDWYGRRAVLIPAMLVALAGTLVFAGSTSLPALLVGRVLTGVAVGAALAAATAFLADLDSGPGAVATRRSQIVSTVANVGGLAVGPLLAGLLVAYLGFGPRSTFLFFTVLVTLAVVGVAMAPELRKPVYPRPRYRPQRLAAPVDARAQFRAALVGDFLVFTVFGVFAGLASAFLGGTLHLTSPVLAGLAVFISFGSGALTQATTMTWPLRRLLVFGIPAMLVGLALVVTAAWLNPPSLALFLTGAGVVGVGSGAIYRSTLTVVLATAPPAQRAGTLALFFVVGYVGLSVPVVAAGVALVYVSFTVVLLSFAVAVATGILVASPLLLRLSVD
jgi:MFS family permease